MQVLEANSTSLDRTAEPENPFAIRIFPNPFNEFLNLQYTLADHAEVQVEIYSTSGKRIKEMVRGSQVRGTYMLRWNGQNAMQRPVPSGVYVCRFLFRSGNAVFLQERKIVFIP